MFLHNCIQLADVDNLYFLLLSVVALFCFVCLCLLSSVAVCSAPDFLDLNLHTTEHVDSSLDRMLLK